MFMWQTDMRETNILDPFPGGNAMTERRLITSTSSFEVMRERGGVYVDKTALIYRLVKENNAYFLARPRRFGKSLLISTLRAYFEAKKELFEGLAIAELEKDWIRYPVFKFDMSGIKDNPLEQLDIKLDYMLSEYESFYDCGSKNINSPGVRLMRLISTARKKTGRRAVVLVDEYDSPLLAHIQDKDLFETLRNRMRVFYSPLKEMSDDLTFVFITGVTKFSQLSIFSELNHLVTISMSEPYAAICGISMDELQTQLKPEITAMAETLGISEKTVIARLRKKYDGYHFCGESPDIYNPLSLLRCLGEKSLKNYWYSTGTPTFLTQMVGKYTLRPEEMDGFLAGEMDFDVPIELAETPIPMLYQSGYLTIKRFDGYDYTLGFPNEEVRVSFVKGLAPYYTKKNAADNNSIIQRLLRAFRNHEIDDAMTLLRSFFSSIPYNAEKQDENHYKTIFYLIFTLATEYSVRTEECSAAGRCDALIETEDTIYLFEFKLDGTAEEALEQIDDKGYAIKYEAGDKPIVKIGANFEKDKRTIERWVVVGR